MFTLIASAIQAYNQIGMFIAALICLGFGGVILGNCLYWRIQAVRVTGTILGVLPEGNVWYPVYRYNGPDGHEHEAKSNSGSNSVRGESTGKSVSLLVSAHDPSDARDSRDYVLDVVGLAFLIPGIWLGYLALTIYPITWMTGIMAAGFAAMGAERLYRFAHLSGTKLSVAQWKQHRGTLDLSRVQPAETVPVDSGAQPRAQWAANRKFAIPLLAIFAAVLATAGCYEMRAVYRLETRGIRAEGEVVRLAESSSASNSGPTYYPVVRFKAAGDQTIEFQDQVGSNPPTRRPGDRVAVLYLESQPEKSMIDRGWLINWLIPGMLLAAAAIGAIICWKVLRAGSVGVGVPARN